MLRMQIQRIPSLAKIQQIIKAFFPQKKQKYEVRLLTENQSLLVHGQLNLLYCLLRLISSFHTGIALTFSQRNRIQSAIEQAKMNNLRMYYRLIFMMAQYCQRQKQTPSAINFLKILLQTSIFPFSQTNSFRKQILKLAKKDKFITELRQIYIDSDWLAKENMVQQLYDSIIFFEEEGNYLQCIANANKYLKCIKQMKQQLQSKKILLKFANITHKTIQLLAKSYIKMQILNEAWEQIKLIDSKIDKQSFNHLLISFCIEAYKEKEYTYCVEAFNLISLQLLLKQPQLVRKQLWKSIVHALIIQNLQLIQAQQIVAIYKSIENFHQEIKAIPLVLQINDYGARKESWRQLSQELNFEHTTSISLQPFQKQLQYLCSNSFDVDKAIKIKHQISTFNQTQINNLIDFVIVLIKKVTISKGKSSEQTVFLHVVLFQTGKLINSLQIQAFVLLWASSFPQQIQGIWNQSLCGSKRGRQIKLDTLLLHLYESQERIHVCLRQLWWFQAKRRDWIKLKTSFCKIKQNHQPLQQDILNFKILYGSYFSIQLQQSALCSSILHKLNDHSQDQI